MKLWNKIMPSRAAARDVGVYANLDKLISEPLPFALNGKVHYLRPVTTGEFYDLANAIFEFNNLSNKETDIDRNAVVDRFYDIVKSLCSTISRKDVEGLHPMQLGALYTLITQHATGKSHDLSAEDLKKKTQAMYGR